MFVTKTESSNTWPTSAVSASATTIERIGQDERDDAGDHGPEDEQEDDQRGGAPKKSSPFWRSSSESVGEVLVDRELAGHRRLDAGLLVEALDRLDHVREAVLVAPRPTSTAVALPSAESSRSCPRPRR